MFDQASVKFNAVVFHDKPFVVDDRYGPADFYDRTEVRQRVLAQIVPKASRKPIIFLGERRSGKTSQILLLKEYLIAYHTAECIPVEVPWQAVANEGYLSREILAAVRTHMKKSAALAASVEALPTPAVDGVRGTIEAMRALSALAPGRKLVLFLEELDTVLITARDFGGMAEWIRVIGLVQALVETEELPIQLVFTAVQLSSLEAGSRGSLLVSRADIIPLEPFSDDDLTAMARDLAGREHPLSDDDVAMLCHLSGGWPYFAKLLLYHLAELPAGSEHMQIALSKALDNTNVAATLTDIYDRHLSASEKSLLLLLVAHNSGLTEPVVKSLGADMQAVVAGLARRGYLLLDVEGNCRLRVEFLRHWFRAWPRYELELERQDVNQRLMTVDQHVNAENPFRDSTPFFASPRVLTNQ